MPIALLNGQAADTDALRALAVVNYGHFTVMQVRNGAVQGLELHLQRLQCGQQALFGTALPREHILAQLRIALNACPAEASLRLTVFAREFDHRQPLRPLPPDLLVTTGPAAPARKPALRVKSYPFVRPVPHVKHVGTFPLFHYRRQAILAGYDDALLVTPEGLISEGSLWNIGFWDGQTLIWPQAPALRGTCEQLVQAGWEQQGGSQQWRPLRLAERADFQAAFALNASGIQPIVSLDGHEYGHDAALMQRLKAALDSQPWLPV